MSRHQNAGQNYNIKIANRSFENVAEFRYLGTRARNQNLIHEEFKIKSGKAYYHSVQKLLSCLLSGNLKTEKYKTIRAIFLVVVYGCVTWSLTLREEHRLKLFEIRVLRSIFEPKRGDIIEDWKSA
jgi:hypothetical protein